MAVNKLLFGDNLRMMREHIATESVDLVYLDPPFNSDRNYNVLFKEQSGEASPAQIEAFTDTWHWDQSARDTYDALIDDAPANVATMIAALRELLGKSDMMAYLAMMTARLLELHRVLKPTGSLYLHCDPTASHYLKIVLDTIFGPKQFRNEIIWRRTGAHNKIQRYAPIHDDILFFTKTDAFTWNRPKRPYMRGHIKENFIKDERGWRTNYYGNVLTGSGIRGGESGKPWRGFDPTAKNRHWAVPGAVVDDLIEAGIDLTGLTQHEKFDLMLEKGFITIEPGEAWPVYGRYLKPSDGQPLSDIWAFQPYTEGTVFGTEAGIDADVRWLQTKDQERLGYPTQKPLALLERIIAASSNPGDVVLDPFCGCGTAVVAAQKLGRHWIGIDVTHLAIALMKSRLKDHFGTAVTFDVEGVPTDVGSARALALQDRYDFQLWALSLVDAKPAEGKLKKGADKGIDGLIGFVDDPSEKLKRCIVQVKSGNVGAKDVRDLIGAIHGKAEFGIFITLDPITKPMREAAEEPGAYFSPFWGKKYPRIQLFTVAELLSGKKPDMPPTRRTYQQAARIAPTVETQPSLFGSDE